MKFREKSAPLALPERNGAKNPTRQIQKNLIGGDDNLNNLIGSVKPRAVWADLTPGEVHSNWFRGTVQLGEILFELHAWALFNEVGTPALRLKLQKKRPPPTEEGGAKLEGVPGLTSGILIGSKLKHKPLWVELFPGRRSRRWFRVQATICAERFQLDAWLAAGHPGLPTLRLKITSLS